MPIRPAPPDLDRDMMTDQPEHGGGAHHADQAQPGWGAAIQPTTTRMVSTARPIPAAAQPAEAPAASSLLRPVSPAAAIRVRPVPARAVLAPRAEVVTKPNPRKLARAAGGGAPWPDFMITAV